MEDTDASLIFRETSCSSLLKTMTSQRFPRENLNTFATRFNSRRLLQVAQSKIGHLDNSVLMP